MILLFCVCAGRGGRPFIKSGRNRDDVLTRCGEDTTIVASGSCPARVVQLFQSEQGDVVGIEEEPVASIMQMVGWTCPSGCTHADVKRG